MPRFVIEKVDSSEETLIAAAYQQVDGYFHFLDDVGDTLLSVCADSVSGIEQLTGKDPAMVPEPPVEAPEPLESGAVLLVRFWSEPEHDRPLRMRISSTRNLHDEPAIAYAGSEEQVLSAVKHWLSQLTGPSGLPGQGVQAPA